MQPTENLSFFDLVISIPLKSSKSVYVKKIK